MKVYCKNKGYTLLELVVVMAIFTMITTSLVSNYRSSTKAMMLSTVANRIISQIRQAQTYALGNTSATAGQPVTYGIYANSTTNNSIIFFIDNINIFPLSKQQYDGPAELVETLRLSAGSVITKLCVNLKKDNMTIADCVPSSAYFVDKLNVTFTRPYPEPSIIPLTSGNVLVGNPPYADAEIVLSTADDTITKTIVIWMTGQLAIE